MKEKVSTIAVSQKTLKRLWSQKTPGVSYDDIITKLLDFWDKRDDV